MVASSLSGSAWQWLRATLQALLDLNLSTPPRQPGRIGGICGDIWSRLRYHRLYEILDYDATLEIGDAEGRQATLTRRDVIGFLQDNVVAIHDHAWGGGEFMWNYRCQPGVPVNMYEDGSKRNILVSLRETKNRGDEIEFWVERTIKEGFTENEEWLETEIDHLMRHLNLSIVFPKMRPCRRATLCRRSIGKTTPLGMIQREMEFLAWPKC